MKTYPKSRDHRAENAGNNGIGRGTSAGFSGKTHHPDNDAKSWYRQFWPCFIVALPILTVCAGLFTLALSLENADSLIEDDYYRQGLAINERFQKEARAEALGLEAVLQISQSNTLSLRLTTGAGRFPEWLQLDFLHALDQRLDLSLNLKHLQGGLYESPTPLPKDRFSEGKWYLSLSPGNSGAQWQLNSAEPVNKRDWKRFLQGHAALKWDSLNPSLSVPGG